MCKETAKLKLYAFNKFTIIQKKSTKACSITNKDLKTVLIKIERLR